MNVYSVVVQVLVLVALIAYSIQCNRLGRRLRQERRDLFTATGLLWALADRTEPKTLYHQQDES